MTFGVALEVLRKQSNCWDKITECSTNCEECECHVDASDLVEAVRAVLDAFGNGSEIPNSSDCISRPTDEAAFWEKRAKEYSDMVSDLAFKMTKGVKFDTIVMNEEGFTLKQAEQKKGHWIPVDDPSITGRCSVCGFESHLCEDDVYGYDYCPNCGARLEVVDDE